MQNNKTKQVLRFLIVVIALITIVAISIIIYQKVSQPNKKAIEAIPQDAALIININNSSKVWKEDISRTDIWDGISTYHEFKQLTAQILFLDSLIHSDAIVSKIISDQTLNISLHNSKDGDYAVLFSIEITKELSEGARNFLSKIFNTTDYSQTEQEGIVIYKSRKAHGFSFYSYQGVFVCSSDLNLLKASSAQIKKEVNLLDNADFIQAKNSAGKKAGISIYINHKQLFNNIANLFGPNIKNAITEIGNIKGWSNTELLLRKDVLLMSGYIVENAQSYLECIKDVTPLDAEFSKELDENTFYFSALSISDFERYNTKYTNYKQLNNNPSSSKTEETIERQNSLALWKKLDPIQVVISASNISNNPAWFLTLKPKDIISSEQILLDEMSSRSANQNEVDTFSYQGQTIGKIDLGNSAQFFGDILFSKIDIHYFLIGKNYIHFAKEKEQLEAMIQRVQSDNSLEKSYVFKSFSNDINTNSTYLFYLSPFNGLKEINSNFDTTHTFGRLLSDLSKKTPYIGAKIGGYQNPYYSVSVCWKYLINANIIEAQKSSKESRPEVNKSKKDKKKTPKSTAKKSKKKQSKKVSSNKKSGKTKR